mgnify:CR=1 FL=1
MLELDVTVNEEIRAARPIKLEDRVKYMTEKNPLLAELRRALVPGGRIKHKIK